jgi:hypothetical protein
VSGAALPSVERHLHPNHFALSGAALVVAFTALWEVRRAYARQLNAASRWSRCRGSSADALRALVQRLAPGDRGDLPPPLRGAALAAVNRCFLAPRPNLALLGVRQWGLGPRRPGARSRRRQDQLTGWVAAWATREFPATGTGLEDSPRRFP